MLLGLKKNLYELTNHEWYLVFLNNKGDWMFMKMLFTYLYVKDKLSWIALFGYFSCENLNMRLIHYKIRTLFLFFIFNWVYPGFKATIWTLCLFVFRSDVFDLRRWKGLPRGPCENAGKRPVKKHSAVPGPGHSRFSGALF